MKKYLNFFVAALALAGSQLASAQVKVTGGGPNATDLVTIEILQDITLRVNQGYTLSGNTFGLTIPGVFSINDGSLYPTSDSGVGGSATSFLNYQTTSSATPGTSIDSFLQFAANKSLGVSFSTADTTIQAGGLLTFKAGTLSRYSGNPSLGIVLSNPGATYTLTESSFFSDDGEGAVSLNSSKVSLVPEPSTYALMGLGALALVVAYRRKRTA